jgi:MFS family permease
VYTACSVAGNIFTILLVNCLGKRRLLLSTIGICSLSFLLIGVIGLFFDVSYYASWTKLILFFLTMISSSMGIMPIGWILISEIFPMKYVYILALLTFSLVNAPGRTEPD